MVSVYLPDVCNCTYLYRGLSFTIIYCSDIMASDVNDIRDQQIFTSESFKLVGN